ncbi:hypothetical protein Plhal304r1_c013g0050261 [Plasmopara halstedii]
MNLGILLARYLYHYQFLGLEQHWFLTIVEMSATQIMKDMPKLLTEVPRSLVPVKPIRKKIAESDSQIRYQMKVNAQLNDANENAMEMATSPRVRMRLSSAKESAGIYSMVCEQSEVVQWMTACHPDLTAFGVDLEQRGYHTLSSIAFLTEEDIDGVRNVALRHLLLSTLTMLRHELFRM